MGSQSFVMCQRVSACFVWLLSLPDGLPSSAHVMGSEGNLLSTWQQPTGMTSPPSRKSMRLLAFTGLL